MVLPSRRGVGRAGIGWHSSIERQCLSMSVERAPVSAGPAQRPLPECPVSPVLVGWHQWLQCLAMNTRAASGRRSADCPQSRGSSAAPSRATEWATADSCCPLPLTLPAAHCPLPLTLSARHVDWMAAQPAPSGADSNCCCLMSATLYRRYVEGYRRS